MNPFPGEWHRQEPDGYPHPLQGASVKEYKFQGGNVYVFEHGMCGADQTSAVLNEDCKTLGYLGGITGNTTINQGNFNSATFTKIIWEN